MKVLCLKNLKWTECIQKAQTEEIVLTKDGKPVVLMVGVEGMDLEQVALGQADKLWHLIEKRRQQPPVSRAELEKRLGKKRAKNHGQIK